MPIFLSLPFEKLLFIDLVDTSEINIDYSNMYLKLRNDYSKANPLTRKKEYEKYIETIYKENIITYEDYDKYKNLISTTSESKLFINYYKNIKFSNYTNSILVNNQNDVKFKLHTDSE